MKIVTTENKSYEQDVVRLAKIGGKAQRWTAEIDDGFWYADSNPCESGDTQEEAIAAVIAELKRWHEGIGKFLREHEASRKAEEEKA